MIRQGLASLSAVLTLAVPTWSAAVPSTMTYQGRLTNPAGVARVGTFNMTFRIFDAPTGGPWLWQEPHNNVTGPVVTDAYGLFEVLLGRDSALTAAHFPNGSSRYLEIEVNGEVLSPRKVLNSVPFAFTPTPTDPAWQTDGTNAFRVGGNVGIGTSGPNELLTLRRDAAGQGAVLRLENEHAEGGDFVSVDADLGNGVPRARLDMGRVSSLSSHGFIALSVDNAGLPGGTLDEVMRIQGDSGGGKVGIGTMNPGAKLDVRGAIIGNAVLAAAASGESQLWVESDVLGTRHGWYQTVSPDLRINYAVDGVWQSIPLAITPIGHVGIGDVSPTQKLDVAGNVQLTGDVLIPTQGQGIILRAIDGPNCFRLTVNNAGMVTTSSVPCP